MANARMQDLICEGTNAANLIYLLSLTCNAILPLGETFGQSINEFIRRLSACCKYGMHTVVLLGNVFACLDHAHCCSMIAAADKLLTK